MSRGIGPEGVKRSALIWLRHGGAWTRERYLTGGVYSTGEGVVSYAAMQTWIPYQVARHMVPRAHDWLCALALHLAQFLAFLPFPYPAPQLPHQPDWTDTSRLVAFTLSDGAGGGLYVAFNTSHLPRLLKLPVWGGRVWQPLVDTSKVGAWAVYVVWALCMGVRVA